MDSVVDRPAAGRFRSGWVGVVRSTAAWILILLVGPLGLAMLFADRMIFLPSGPDAQWEAGRALGFEEIELTAADGVKTVSWYLEREGARCALILFHGNAGNLAHRAAMARALSTLNSSVLLVGYHGYGKSGGRAGEAAVYDDADTAWRYLTEQRGLAPSRIALFGESLGCAPAIELARRRACAGLILQSPFSSIADMVRVVLSFYPGHWLVRTKMDNLSKIDTLSVPILIGATRRDEVVPYVQSRRVFEIANEPKTWIEFEDGGHNDLFWRHQRGWLEAIGRFLDHAVAEPSPGPAARPDHSW